MTCPVHNDDGHTNRDTSEDDASGELDRRGFMKSALTIGGASALATATGLYGVPDTARATPGEPIGVATRDNRQHAWDGFETDVSEGGVNAHPEHHVTLHLDYAHGGTPSPAHRRRVDRALREIERYFEWHSEGVLFTVGYAPTYFDRFDESLPEGLNPDGDIVKPGLLRPQGLIDAPGVTLDREDPAADEAEVCLHLASNNAQNILAVEALLWGGEYEVDGETVSFEATVEGVLETAGEGDGRPKSYPYRRVGFSGNENVSENLEADTDFDPDRIPDDAELMMGFNDLYRNSIPREDNATILEDQQLVSPHPPGVFAQGTIQHVSKLDIDLARFYDENDDTQSRRELMFSPDHDADNTGTVGENLGNSNAPGDTAMRNLDGESTDKAEQVVEDYENEGTVGHAQKLARARFDMESRLTPGGRDRLSGGDRDELLPGEEADDDLPGHDGEQEAEQVLLRRDVTSTDQNTPGNLFISLMRFNPYMVYMRQAMNGVAFDSANFGFAGDDRIQDDAIGTGPNSGIVNYLETKRRGNYLVPPITLRALPHPRGEMIDIEVARAGRNYRVTVDGVVADDLADGSVRFGWFYDVNRARGIEPRQVTQQGGRTTFVFPADGTGIDTAPGGPDGDVRVRLFATDADTGRPIRGTATIDPDEDSDSGSDSDSSSGRGRGDGGDEGRGR